MVCVWDDGHVGGIGCLADCLFAGLLPVCAACVLFSFWLRSEANLLVLQVKTSHLNDSSPGNDLLVGTRTALSR